MNTSFLKFCTLILAVRNTHSFLCHNFHSLFWFVTFHNCVVVAVLPSRSPRLTYDPCEYEPTRQKNWCNANANGPLTRNRRSVTWVVMKRSDRVNPGMVGLIRGGTDDYLPNTYRTDYCWTGAFHSEGSYTYYVTQLVREGRRITFRFP